MMVISSDSRNAWIYDVGTGKSEVGAHLAYIFAVKNGGHGSVLYCGPSNKAVDVVHGKKPFACRISYLIGM